MALDMAIGVTLRVDTDSAVIGLILKNPRFLVDNALDVCHFIEGLQKRPSVVCNEW